MCRVAGGFLRVTPGSRSPQLTSLSDRYVSHFETEGPHVLLYFDSVSKEGDRGAPSWHCVSRARVRGFPRRQVYQQLLLWERTCGVSRETGQEGSEPWPALPAGRWG